MLATVSGLVAGVALAGSGVQVALPHFSSAYAAENAQRMPGFADLVEKVKPAVISVRVKVDGARMMSFEGETPLAPNSPMERFFRRFGLPFGDETPDMKPMPHNRPMTGQGSGF